MKAAFFITVITLLLTTGECWANQPISAPEEEVRFHQILNQFRQILGLNSIEIHPSLQSAARKHSAWMAEREFLTHNGPNPQDTLITRVHLNEGYPYQQLGENVACGSEDAVGTFLQWAFSPGHLKNMLNPNFKEMGIAREGDGTEQCPYYWTNDFGSRQQPNSKNQGVLDPVKIKAAIQKVTGKEPAEIHLELQ